jgi:esterase/lipase superfamily enzyme
MDIRSLLVAAVIVLASCAPRGELAYAPSTSGNVRQVFVGSTRGVDAKTGADYGYSRRESLELSRFDVSIPAQHTIGELNHPKKGRHYDPNKDFVVAASKTYPAPPAFRSDLRRSLADSKGEAIVFVHGFNNTFAEGLYRVAQMGEDFGLPGTLVYYAWPSRGHVLGYAYDRDSALFARDGLRDLLDQLRQSGARRILLVGHSMGSAVTMETLRDMKTSGETETFSRLSGVMLISPDIDVDVFREEARSIGTLPQPFVIFTSQKDKALLVSSRIAGEADRMGNLRDVSKVSDLKVTLIDTGAFNVADGHFNLANNPALIRLLTRTSELAKILQGEQAGRRNLASGVVMTVQNATQIILSPISALGGR